MLRRLVAVMVAVLFGVAVAAAGLGYAPELAGASTPSPVPVSPSPAATTGTGSEPQGFAGPPGWLLIVFGVAIIIFAWSGGAARLQKRFQRPEPPDRP